MARRKARSGARWVKWTPAMADLFRPAFMGEGWTPPASVRLSLGQSRMTLSARFTAPGGTVMTARLRLSRDCESGDWGVVGEELSIPLGTIRSGAEV